jgi:adenosylmethionine-8-amino-7-oxononanoate aminotransferase
LNTGDISIEVVIDNTEHGWTLVEPEKLVQIDTGYHGHTVARNSVG